MGFCDLHKQKCENIINIIEFKKGKITELNLCEKCLFDLNIDISEIKIEEVKTLVFKNKCPKCGVIEEELKSSKLLCPNCYIHFDIKNKINLLKIKMMAAVKVEDYETAAILKKEIDQINS